MLSILITKDCTCGLGDQESCTYIWCCCLAQYSPPWMGYSSTNPLMSKQEVWKIMGTQAEAQIAWPFELKCGLYWRGRKGREMKEIEKNDWLQGMKTGWCPVLFSINQAECLQTLWCICVKEPCIIVHAAYQWHVKHRKDKELYMNKYLVTAAHFKLCCVFLFSSQGFSWSRWQCHPALLPPFRRHHIFWWRWCPNHMDQGGRRRGTEWRRAAVNGLAQKDLRKLWEPRLSGVRKRWKGCLLSNN